MNLSTAFGSQEIVTIMIMQTICFVHLLKTCSIRCRYMFLDLKKHEEMTKTSLRQKVPAHAN